MPNKETVIIFHRLSPEVYADLEKKFSKPIVTSQTSAHEAGYQLGIQHILQELRRGYVVQTSN